MKKIFSFYLILLLPVGTLQAINWEKEMALEVGATFKNSTRAVYLECDMNDDKGVTPGTSRQHFKIRLLNDTIIKGISYKGGTEVGGTGIGITPRRDLLVLSPLISNHHIKTTVSVQMRYVLF